MGPNRPRIDWQAERDRIDLAAVATGLLGPAPGRRGARGKDLWWSCPLGTHADANPSFRVYQDQAGHWQWKCYGCGEHGDAADLVMRVRNVSFPEAKAELVGDPSPSGEPRPRPTPMPRPGPPAAPRSSGLPEADALALVNDAERRLWAPEGADALAYLTGPRRGLTIETIRAARLGWTPGVCVPRKGGDGTYHAEGITIPTFDGDLLTLVKVRQPDGRRPKYAEVHRGERHTGLYPGRQTIRPGHPLVIVEGELDRILLGQELGDLAAVVTLGSASNRPSPGILYTLLAADPWFLATDADPAGDKVATDWPASARRVRPPGPHKDWTEARQGGVDLRRWWSDILAGADRPILFTWPELSTWRWGPAIGDPEPGIILD